MKEKQKPYQTVNCWRSILNLVFPEKPKFSKLTFTYPAWLKLQCYINLVGEYEITGFGRIIDDKIVDIKIIPQTVKSAEVDCDIDAMVDFMKQVPKDERGQWILDWHSHVNMGVFMSGTDSSNYEEQLEARLNQQFPVMIVNKKGDIWCQNYMETGLKPIEVTIDKSSDIDKDTLFELYSQCERDVQTMCKKKEYVTYADRWSKLYTKSDDSKQTSIWDNIEDEYSWGYQDSRYNPPTYNKKKDTINDDVDYCISCNSYLVEPDEYDRGICDECWNLMTPVDRDEWIKNLRKG